MVFDGGAEGLAVGTVFLLADAVGGEEGGVGCGAVAGHVAEGGVAEDDVGGDVFFVGDFSAQLAQGVEQGFVYAFP